MKNLNEFDIGMTASTTSAPAVGGSFNSTVFTRELLQAEINLLDECFACPAFVFSDKVGANVVFSLLHPCCGGLRFSKNFIQFWISDSVSSKADEYVISINDVVAVFDDDRYEGLRNYSLGGIGEADAYSVYKRYLFSAGAF
jgi:hypothetical protein